MGLKEAREVAALPQLRHPQVQCAQTGIKGALSIPVALGGVFTAALVPSGNELAVDIGIHNQLPNSLGDAAQKSS